MALFPGVQATPSSGDDVILGRFRFRVVYRQAGSDEGLTIHVFGPRHGAEEEVLRFDCFRGQPHYHLGWSYRDERFSEIAAADPFDWALHEIQNRMSELLGCAEADPMDDVESERLADAVTKMRGLGERLDRDA